MNIYLESIIIIDVKLIVFFVVYLMFHVIMVLAQKPIAKMRTADEIA
jgi:hypothetical protein